ncbi:MAG: type III toxin-antitoxin system ToxN/AbiQ family toxin [Oscillospiraceae bacterium]|nr:type III toxin-antitoxin system ToxN/AbiQ family toxin [Oscillospiraceae bacterium]
MEQNRLSIYQIDMKYIRDLSNKDENVRSVSPQINKEKRPFVGIVVVNDNKQYCIPFSSPKPKHYQMKNDVDFTKMFDDQNKLIGVLNFNNMIPVDESVLIPFNLEKAKNDTPEIIHYKKMVKKQLNWCQKNQNSIVSKANKLYYLVTETPEKYIYLTRRCCDFKKLEAVLEKRFYCREKRV